MYDIQPTRKDKHNYSNYRALQDILGEKFRGWVRHQRVKSFQNGCVSKTSVGNSLYMFSEM